MTHCLPFFLGKVEDGWEEKSARGRLVHLGKMDDLVRQQRRRRVYVFNLLLDVPSLRIAPAHL